MSGNIHAFRIIFFDCSGQKSKQLNCLKNEDPHLHNLNQALFAQTIEWSNRAKLPSKCEVRLEFDNIYSAELEIPEFFTKVAADKGWKISIHVNR